MKNLALRSAALTLAVAACLAAPTVSAAVLGGWVDTIAPLATPAGPASIPLPITGPARAAGAEPHEAWASRPGAPQRMIYNITRPSIIPPAPSVTGVTRPAVILVPGGGFEFLAIDNEGFDIAKRLEPLGVAVFILKYRTVALPDSFQGFHDAIAYTFAQRPRPGGPVDITADVPYAVADTDAALRWVRAHAGEYGVDPKRVGVVGFSAGAIATLAMAQAAKPEARADFLGLIYGSTKTTTIPASPPPLFDALAADDRFFGHDDLGLIDGWRRAGGSIEFHLYSAGGHGFASQPNGTTSDDWFAAFAHWLNVNKFASGAQAR